MLDIPPEHDTPELRLREVAAEREARQFVDAIRPTRPISILDIGCGIALTSLLMTRMTPVTELVLMDGEGGEKLNSFHNSTRPWSSLIRLAAVAQAVSQAGMYMIVPAYAGATYPCDVIMSLLSWGHHYPVGTYAALAARSLPEGGKLIIDLRKSKSQSPDRALGELRGYGFVSVSMLYEYKKLQRHLLEKRS